jgi:hypothetical protein
MTWYLDCIMSVQLNVREIKKALEVVGGQTVELGAEGGYATFRIREDDLEVLFGVKTRAEDHLKSGTVPAAKLLSPLIGLHSGVLFLSVNNRRSLSLSNSTIHGNPSNRNTVAPFGKALPKMETPKNWGMAQYRFDLEADHFRQALKYGLVIPASTKDYSPAHLHEGRIFFTDGDRVHVTSGFPNFCREGGFRWPRPAAEAAFRALSVMPRYGQVSFLTWVKAPTRRGARPSEVFQSLTYVRGDYFVRIQARSAYRQALDLGEVLPQKPAAVRVKVGLASLRSTLRSTNGTGARLSAKQVFVNPKFMLDALIPFRRNAVIELRDSKSPILVTGDADDKFALVMPATPEKGAVP